MCRPCRVQTRPGEAIIENDQVAHAPRKREGQSHRAFIGASIAVCETCGLESDETTVSSIAEEAESGPLVGNPDSHLGRRNVDDAAGNETDPIRDEVGLHAG